MLASFRVAGLLITRDIMLCLQLYKALIWALPSKRYGRVEGDPRVAALFQEVQVTASNSTAAAHGPHSDAVLHFLFRMRCIFRWKVTSSWAISCR